MDDSVTHLAGPPITIGSRTIQRCSICGEKLIDCDLRNLMVPEGEKHEALVWQIGRLVQKEGNRSSVLPDSNELPEDSCISMVEE